MNAPLTSANLARLDAVILDPPPGGARTECAEIVRSEVTRIVMVSCKTASFGRNAATLANGSFSCNWAEVIDQFRMSNHIELVSQLSRIQAVNITLFCGGLWMKKRSIKIRGHMTSVSLEDEFWTELGQIAEDRGISVASLVAEIDSRRAGGLSSAIRLFVLATVKSDGTDGA